MFFTPFSIQVWFFFTVLLAASVGAGVIAGDVASRSLTMYRSRPITRLDYLAAKSGVVAAPLALAPAPRGSVAVVIVLSLGYVSLPVALQAAGAFILVGLLGGRFVHRARGSVLVGIAEDALCRCGIFGSLVSQRDRRRRDHGDHEQPGRFEYVSLDADLIAVAQPLLNAGGNPLDPWVAGGILVAFSAFAFLAAFYRSSRTEVVAE